MPNPVITPNNNLIMIDLHCHLLPGIDDGPKTMAESLNMAEYAVTQGISHAVVTPHIQPGTYNNDLTNITQVFATFQQAVMAKGIELTLGMAAEVRLCAELPSMISQNRIPFLGKWGYAEVILLEFPHEQVPVGADKLVAWLQQRNILPMIAHPERNQAIIAKKEKLLPFIQAGCLIQITASSVTGLFGENSRKLALWLLENQYATLLATDAHNLHKRIPSMTEAKAVVAQLFGNDMAEQLTRNNPAKLLNLH